MPVKEIESLRLLNVLLVLTIVLPDKSGFIGIITISGSKDD
jgi:hypothetical protein